MEWTGCPSWTNTNCTGSSAMTWVLERHCSPSVFWLETTTSGTDSFRCCNYVGTDICRLFILTAFHSCFEVKHWKNKKRFSCWMLGLISILCDAGLRNMPRLRQQTLAPCLHWWCVLPHSPATGWMKLASFAPKSTSTPCTILGLPQKDCGKSD